MSEQPNNLRFETLQLHAGQGIEHIEDIKADLQQAFKRVFAPEPVG